VDLDMRPLGETAATVRGSIAGEQELALVAAAPAGEGIHIGGIQTDAQVLYIGAAGWAVTGGTGLSVGGQPLAGAAGDLTAEMRDELEALWARTQPAEHPLDGLHGPAASTPLWTYDGFLHLPPTVAAPVLTSEPPLEVNMSSLLDGVVTRSPTVSWPGGKDVTLRLDLRESLPISRIDLHVGVLGGENTIPDPATYPAPRTVLAELSDLPAEAGTRTRELTFGSSCTFEGLHKGVVYPILRWTCDGVGESGRYLKLTFRADQWPSLGLNELSVRAAGPSVARILGSVQRDVDGDGLAELLVWTDQAELATLRNDGAVLWQRSLPGYITAAECYGDLAPGGPRVLVTTREARLYCLDAAGQELWRTDFIESAKLNGDLPTGYSIGLLKQPDGSPLIVVGCYNLASFVSPDGQVLKYERLPAAYQTMTLPRGFDYDGDGLEDIVSTEVWGCLSVLDATMCRRAGGSLPRGRGILLDYLRPPTDTEAKAAVCTETGCGVLDLKTLKYDWLRGVAPIRDCARADLDGDGRMELALAKEDGYVLVFNEAGELRHSAFVGEPVRAIAPLPGGKLALALPGRIVRYDAATGAQEPLATGDYRRLALCEGKPVLLAFAPGARVDAYRVE